MCSVGPQTDRGESFFGPPTTKCGIENRSFCFVVCHFRKNLPSIYGCGLKSSPFLAENVQRDPFLAGRRKAFKKSAL